MSDRAFTTRSPEPSAALLAETLGDAHLLWRALIDEVSSEHPALREEWKFYAGSGWTMKLLDGKRNLIFMIPHHGAYRVGLVFGERAVKAIEAGSFPKRVLELLANARKNAEGRGINLDVGTKRDLATVKKLLAVKAAH